MEYSVYEELRRRGGDIIMEEKDEFDSEGSVEDFLRSFVKGKAPLYETPSRIKKKGGSVLEDQSEEVLAQEVIDHPEDEFSTEAVTQEDLIQEEIPAQGNLLEVEAIHDPLLDKIEAYKRQYK